MSVIRVDFGAVANPHDIEELKKHVEEILELTVKQTEKSSSAYVRQNLEDIMDMFTDIKIDLDDMKEELNE